MVKKQTSKTPSHSLDDVSLSDEEFIMLRKMLERHREARRRESESN